MKEEDIRLLVNKSPIFTIPFCRSLTEISSNQFNFHFKINLYFLENRWKIEPFFKKLKQNVEGGFFSDIRERIQTQSWIVLIANMISYVCLVSIICSPALLKTRTRYWNCTTGHIQSGKKGR